MFDNVSKHFEVRQKYSAARRIYNSPLGVSKCGQTRSFVFDILPHRINLEGAKMRFTFVQKRKKWQTTHIVFKCKRSSLVRTTFFGWKIIWLFLFYIIQPIVSIVRVLSALTQQRISSVNSTLSGSLLYQDKRKFQM